MTAAVGTDDLVQRSLDSQLGLLDGLARPPDVHHLHLLLQPLAEDDPQPCGRAGRVGAVDGGDDAVQVLEAATQPTAAVDQDVAVGGIDHALRHTADRHVTRRRCLDAQQDHVDALVEGHVEDAPGDADRGARKQLHVHLVVADDRVHDALQGLDPLDVLLGIGIPQDDDHAHDAPGVLADQRSGQGQQLGGRVGVGQWDGHDPRVVGHRGRCLPLRGVDGLLP